MQESPAPPSEATRATENEKTARKINNCMAIDMVVRRLGVGFYNGTVVL